MKAKPTTNIHESAKRILSLERKIANGKSKMDEEREKFAIFRRSCKYFHAGTRFGDPQGTGIRVRYTCTHTESCGLCIPGLCQMAFEK